MGYEINYSPEDYAQASAACTMVAVQAGLAGETIQHGLLRAAASRMEAQLRANAVGLETQLPAGRELGRMLQELCRQSSLRQGEAEDLAAKVRAAMDNARQAERRVQAMLALLAAPETLGDVMAAAWRNGGRPGRDETEGLLGLLGVLANGEALPWVASSPAGTPVHDAMQWISGMLDEQNVVPRRPVVIERVQDLPPLILRGSLGDYYQLQDLARRKESRILVGRSRSRGREVFVVIVPGTQPGHGTGNPLDARGILDALGNGSANYARAVTQALEVSGARPGSEIILVGHSQGGIHAANLAGNAMLRKKFKIRSVLTLGAPVGAMTLPPDVKSLHLEDGTDPVPGMDGTPNRRGRGQVTATFPGPANPNRLDAGGFGRGHQLENYRDHLAEVQRSPVEDVQPIISALVLAPGPMQLKGFRLRRRRKELVAHPEREADYRKLGQIAPHH